MRISVWHNGVLVHDAVELSNKTGAGKPETADPLPTKLQDHGNPVVYRNLWIVDTTQRPAAAPSLPIPVSAPPTPLAIRPPYPYSATIGGPIAGPLPVHWQGN
jgi:hypothetical protein